MKKISRGKTWVEVSSSALRHNLVALQKIVAPSASMAVLKSNAYGHGLHEAASIVAPLVDWMVVDSLDEARELRAQGLKGKVLIIGYIPPESVPDLVKLRCSAVAYSKEMLSAIRRVKAKPGSFRLHLKIETGTTRQGLEGSELVAFARAAATIPSVAIEGVYTHFANIEDTLDPSYAKEQLARFNRECDRLKKAGFDSLIRHSAASAAALMYPETRFDAARLGIAMYGHWPSREARIAIQKMYPSLTLQPVLTWKTLIAQVKDVAKGTPVSYGLTERVTRASRIAVLPVGYWDGYDRGLSSIGRVLIRGHVCKVIGRVCMNMMMVDVTDVPGARSGDEVVLIGSQKKSLVSAEQMAESLGTIQYEVLTRINPRTPRIIVH
ncbi:MAG: alanine racemase [Candidatus Uhrbacteria bacterium]|nr:alanine racemase [Candidatus Uhrbacteria bacterium]